MKQQTSRNQWPLLHECGEWMEAIIRLEDLIRMKADLWAHHHCLSNCSSFSNCSTFSINILFKQQWPLPGRESPGSWWYTVHVASAHLHICLSKAKGCPSYGSPSGFFFSKRVLGFSLTWLQGLMTGDFTTVQLQKALWGKQCVRTHWQNPRWDLRRQTRKVASVSNSLLRKYLQQWRNVHVSLVKMTLNKVKPKTQWGVGHGWKTWWPKGKRGKHS